MQSSPAHVEEAVSRLRQLDDVSLGTLSSDALMRERMKQLLDAFDRLSCARSTPSQLELVA